MSVAVVLLLVGLPLSAFGIFAVAVSEFHGDAKEIVASVVVVLLCLSPLIIGAVTLGTGIEWLLRASRLRELRVLVYGRESISSSELALRTRRPEHEMLALLVRAEKLGAAWRTS